MESSLFLRLLPSIRQKGPVDLFEFQTGATWWACPCDPPYILLYSVMLSILIMHLQKELKVYQ